VIILLATVAAAAAILLFFASFLMSGAFAGKVPSGQNAVGLVIPLGATVIATVLLVLAGALAASLDRLDWIGLYPGRWIAVVSLTVGIGAVLVLLAWMEQLGSWVTPVGIGIGALAPIGTGAMILLCLWAPTTSATSSWQRPAAAMFALSIILTVWTAWALLADWWHFHQDNQARVEGAHVSRDSERERRDGMTVLDRLREDYAAYSPDTPLWIFVAGLPKVTDPQQRAFIISRALQVPEFDWDLGRTLTSNHPLYRHGAIELLRHVDQPVPRDWCLLLAKSIDVSVREMTEQADWLDPNAHLNPDPTGHIDAMFAAAARCTAEPELDTAISALKLAVAGQTQSR
jgi:hypothetical protein